MPTDPNDIPPAIRQLIDLSHKEPVRVSTRKGDRTAVPLAGGGFAIVDAEDAPTVNGRRWSLDRDGYAQRSAKRPDLPSGWSSSKMHREIVRPQPGEQVDHINGTRIDNRRKNLRPVTNAGNQQNLRGAQSNNRSSGVRGVFRSGEKWRAVVRHAGKHHHCGTFATVAEAEQAVRRKRRDLGFLGGAE